MHSRFPKLLVLLALIALLPATAAAHVRLRRSEPGAGAILTTTPLKLQFWFTEPVELSITRITLADGNGKPIALEEPSQGSSDKALIETELLTPLGAGTYRISYQTVALDGHPLKGSYTFRVLAENEVLDSAFAAAATKSDQDSAAAHAAAAAKAKAAERPVDVLEMRTTDPLYVFMRFISFTLLIVITGAPLFWFLVLRNIKDADAATWKRIASRMASLGALLSLGFLVAGAIRLFLQTRLVTGNDIPDMGDISGVLRHTNWGAYWQLQMTAVLITALVYLLRHALKRGYWLIATLGALALVVATSQASHAGASAVMHAFGVVNDALHLLAVSAWIGGLFWLVVAALPVLGTVERRSKRLVALVNGFSRVALVSVGVVIFTGIVSARFRVGTLNALVSSSYGQALLLKLVAVALVALFGFHNWKTVRPSLEAEGTVQALRQSGQRELLAALVVIAVTALLVALPTPVSG